MQAASALSANAIASPGGESAAAPDASGGSDAFASALAALMGVLGPAQPTSDPTSPAAGGGGGASATSAGAYQAAAGGSGVGGGAGAATGSAAALPLSNAASGVVAGALQALDDMVADLQAAAQAVGAPAAPDAGANGADASATAPGASQGAAAVGTEDPLLALLAELSNPAASAAAAGAASPNGTAADPSSSGQSAASPADPGLDPQLIRFIARATAAAQGDQAAASAPADTSDAASPGSAPPTTDAANGGAPAGQPAAGAGAGAGDTQAPPSTAPANPIAAGLVVFNPSGAQPAPPPLTSTRLTAAKPDATSAPAGVSTAKPPGQADVKASSLALFDAGRDDGEASAQGVGGDTGQAAGDGQGSGDSQGSGDPSAGAPPPAFQLAAAPGAAPQAVAIPPAAQALAQAHGADITAQVAAQIASRAGAVRSSFDFSLEPHGLGRVDVNLKIDAQGSLSAVLSFDNPAVAAEARNRAGDLHQALQQAGFDVSQGGLSFTTGGGQGQGAPFQSAGQPSHGPSRASIAASALPELSAITATFARRPAAGGLDITI